MAEKFVLPEVKMECTLVSSDYHCGDATLVKVEKGTGALAVVSRINGYEIMLNDQLLFSVNEDEYCPTCGGYIYRGYGERNVTMEQTMAFSDQINAPYAGIRTAVQRIRPLLGLLPSGCYMVGDYELFPFTEGAYFWHFTGIPAMFAAWGERMGLEHYALHTCPAHIIPTQRAASCNPERIEHYIRQLESEDYPRAIGLYTSGNTVLLLDGHHKAAAAAAKGKMVKCLVIMPVTISEEADVKTDSGNLLHHGNQLLNASGKPVGWVSPCFSRFADYREDRDVQAGGELSDWGSIPPQYVPEISAYHGILHQEMMEWLYFGKKESYEHARDTLRGMYFTPKNKSDVLYLLRWHQAQFNVLSGGALTPWQMPLFDRKQWNELLRLARRYGIDRDPKTANAVYGVFSFLPGQREIRDIPEVLAGKLKTESIHTVLIPNSVGEVDNRIFDLFPNLEQIVLEKGDPRLRPEPFRAIAERIRKKREQNRDDELHLKQYPFADLARMLEEKQT